MSKHTSGSWSVETGVDDRNEPCFFIRAEPREVSVPVLGSREWAPILAIVRREEGSISDAEFKGNARLMASSPELFSACHNALKLLRGSGFTENTAVIKELKAAIAKAQGDEG